MQFNTSILTINDVQCKVTQRLCLCVLWVFSHRSKYGQGTLEGNRFKTHSNGTLEIKRIRMEDQGTYLCVVSNIAGRDESQARIEVKGEGHIVMYLRATTFYNF